MTDEGKATALIALWSIAFHAGMFTAAFFNRPIGFTLMICSSVVLAVYLHEDGKLEAERRRRKRYEADCERRAKEAMNHDD